MNLTKCDNDLWNNWKDLFAAVNDDSTSLMEKIQNKCWLINYFTSNLGQTLVLQAHET